MSGVQTVNIYDALKSHRNEYLYFRTDHHWTALGAYCGYEQFAGLKEVEPVPIDRYAVKEFSGFLGAFYSDTGKSPLWPRIPIPSPPMCRSTTHPLCSQTGTARNQLERHHRRIRLGLLLRIQRLHRWRQPLHPHRQPGSERRLRLPGGQGILRQRLDPLPDPSLSGYPCDRLPVLQAKHRGLCRGKTTFRTSCSSTISPPRAARRWWIKWTP